MSTEPPEFICYLGVGSNIDPESNIPAALLDLDRAAGVRLAAISTFYRTPPLDAPGTDDFYNGVVAVITSRSVSEVQGLLADVEACRGRRRSADRNAPRPIDLDLLLYGDLEAPGPGLRLPHPDVETRAFVALPLLEVAPDLDLPGTRGPLRQVAAGFREGPGAPLHDFSTRLRARLLNLPD